MWFQNRDRKHQKKMVYPCKNAVLIYLKALNNKVVLISVTKVTVDNILALMLLATRNRVLQLDDQIFQLAILLLLMALLVN